VPAREFGLPGTVAWIETIGVDPAYRRRGVAEALVEQFASSAEDHGIKTIFTLMNTNQTELQYFFQSNRLCPRENDSLSIRFIGLTPDAVAIFPSQKGPAPWILSCRKN